MVLLLGMVFHSLLVSIFEHFFSFQKQILTSFFSFLSFSFFYCRGRTVSSYLGEQRHFLKKKRKEYSYQICWITFLFKHYNNNHQQHHHPSTTWTSWTLPIITQTPTTLPPQVLFLTLLRINKYFKWSISSFFQLHFIFLLKEEVGKTRIKYYSKK